MNLLAKAIAIASKAHVGQLDKGGKPYILHPLWVMDKVRHLGEDYMIVAVLHDVIEDTHYEIDTLMNALFGRKERNSTRGVRIETALVMLDFRGTDYMARIIEIAHNKIAKAVKLRDIEHNSKITRLKDVRKKDFDRLQKYSIAYKYLS